MGCGVFRSLKSPYLSTMSQQFLSPLKDGQIYIYDKKSIYKVINLLLISTRPSLFLTHGEISVILTTEEWQRQDLVAW